MTGGQASRLASLRSKRAAEQPATREESPTTLVAAHADEKEADREWESAIAAPALYDVA
jgi:hypothetical protein